MKGPVRAAAISLVALTEPGLAANLVSQDGLEIGFNGYLRTGLGWSNGGQIQTCFWAPGASFKYRLGNECENYASVGGHAEFTLWDNVFAEYVKYEFRTPFEVDYGAPLFIDEPIMNYLEIGHIGSTSTKAWIGRRESFLKDIYITDYNYMNFRGDGLGIYDIPALGPIKLSYSYIFERLLKDDATGTVYQHNHDFGVSGIETNPGGFLALDARLSRIDDDGTGTLGVHGADGWSFAIRHEQQNILGGYNTLVLQYGRGVGRAAFAYHQEADWVAAALISPESADSLEDAETLRLLSTHLYDGEDWAVMGLILLESKRSSDFDYIDQTWISIGARPTWFIDDNWRLTGEIGVDYVQNRIDHSSGHLVKQTLALEWAPENEFFSRPAFRAFVTRADWSDSFKGQIGWPYYTDETHAWSIGLQVEYWW